MIRYKKHFIAEKMTNTSLNEVAPLKRSSKLYLLFIGYAAWQKLRFRKHLFDATVYLGGEYPF